MNYLDITNWNRKPLFDHFRTLQDPTFAITANVDVTKAYTRAKENKQSFYLTYFHACMIAINSVENLKYRIDGDKIAIYDVINASATIARPDTTFGFSYFDFSENFTVFANNFQQEKERILNSNDLFPPTYSPGCIHSSAIPWVSFTGHKEPYMGDKDASVPQLAFGKLIIEENKKLMPVAINVNHALVDGLHIGQFFEKFQQELDKMS